MGNGAWRDQQPCKETVVGGRSVLRIARADLADPRKQDVPIVLQKPVEHVLGPFQLAPSETLGWKRVERERGRQEASGRRMREALPNGSDHTPQITVFLGRISPLRSPLLLLLAFPPPRAAIPRYLRILTSPDDDLNNHYMRGRISQMKPLVSSPSPRSSSPEEMGKTMAREDGQRTRGITR